MDSFPSINGDEWWTYAYQYLVSFLSKWMNLHIPVFHHQIYQKDQYSSPGSVLSKRLNLPSNLLQEFFNQSDLEKLEGLPVSPFMDREKVTKPSSQCSFIGFVLLPLFEALGKVLPELDVSTVSPQSTVSVLLGG